MTTVAPRNLIELKRFLRERPWVELAGLGKDKRVKTVCFERCGPTGFIFKSRNNRTYLIEFFPPRPHGHIEIWFSADGFRVEGDGVLSDVRYLSVEKV